MLEPARPLVRRLHFVRCLCLLAALACSWLLYSQAAQAQDAAPSAQPPAATGEARPRERNRPARAQEASPFAAPGGGFTGGDAAGDPGQQAGVQQISLDLSTGKLPDLSTLFNTSPVINAVIIGLSVIGVVLFIYLLLSINSRSMMPSAFVDDVTRLVLDRQYNEAASVCRHHRHIFVASILQRCVENAEKDHSVIMEMVDAEGQRRANLLWDRVDYLMQLSSVAPMLGLLGTVLGMLQAFFVLPSTQSASINSKALAMSIGGAMTTTFFGLIVAIMAIIFYSIIKSRATHTLADIEQVVHSIVDHLKRGEA